jgi:predicted nucleotidyltransferase
MMNFGLTDDELRLLRKIVLTPLTQRGAKVWCFGSRATGRHTKYSDIDLMVESTADLRQVIGAIHEAIVESSFPYKVDIVELKDFAKEYKSNFESEKKIIS